MRGSSVAATLSAALASCRKHLVLVTRVFTDALSIPLVQESIEELLERGCKICILITHPSDINEKINSFASTKKILITYMQDPEAEYAIVDLSPMYMRSARLRLEKLLTTLENVLRIKTSGKIEIEELARKKISEIERRLDEIYEKCTYIDPSDLLRKCIETRNMCGELLEVYAATLPIEAEVFDTEFKYLFNQFTRLWNSINTLEEKVLEYRFAITEREDEQYRNMVKICKTELKNLSAITERTSGKLDEAMTHREHYTRMLKELIKELKLLTE